MWFVAVLRGGFTGIKPACIALGWWRKPRLFLSASAWGVWTGTQGAKAATAASSNRLRKPQRKKLNYCGAYALRLDGIGRNIKGQNKMLFALGCSLRVGLRCPAVC